jgi:hypothetical protein
MVSKQKILENVKKHILNAVENLSLCLDTTACNDARKDREKIKKYQDDLMKIHNSI